MHFHDTMFVHHTVHVLRVHVRPNRHVRVMHVCVYVCMFVMMLRARKGLYVYMHTYMNVYTQSIHTVYTQRQRHAVALCMYAYTHTQKLALLV